MLKELAAGFEDCCWSGLPGLLFCIGFDNREPESRADSVGLALCIKVPWDSAHRQDLKDSVNGPRATFQLFGDSCGVPSAWSRDQAKHADEPAEPFTLTSPSFRVRSLLFLDHGTVGPSLLRVRVDFDRTLSMCRLWVNWRSDPLLAAPSATICNRAVSGITSR